MRRYGFFLLVFIVELKTQAQLKAEPLILQPTLYTGDWLIKPVTHKAVIYTSADKKDIILYNGLVR